MSSFPFPWWFILQFLYPFPVGFTQRLSTGTEVRQLRKIISNSFPTLSHVRSLDTLCEILKVWGHHNWSMKMEATNTLQHDNTKQGSKSQYQSSTLKVLISLSNSDWYQAIRKIYSFNRSENSKYNIINQYDKTIIFLLINY